MRGLIHRDGQGREEHSSIAKASEKQSKIRVNFWTPFPFCYLRMPLSGPAEILSSSSHRRPCKIHCKMSVSSFLLRGAAVTARKCWGPGWVTRCPCLLCFQDMGLPRLQLGKSQVNGGELLSQALARTGISEDEVLSHLRYQILPKIFICFY